MNAITAHQILLRGQVYDEFCAKAVAFAKAKKVGNPNEADTAQGSGSNPMKIIDELVHRSVQVRKHVD